MQIIIDPWFFSSPINLHLKEDNNITDNCLFVWIKGILKRSGLILWQGTYLLQWVCNIEISKIDIIERDGIDWKFLSKHY